MREIVESETTNLYHHEIHKKKVSKSAILELQTEEGVMTGHKECSNFISQSVSKLLENPFCFDKNSQETLLEEIDVCFSIQDNEKMLKTLRIITFIISTKNPIVFQSRDSSSSWTPSKNI